MKYKPKEKRRAFSLVIVVLNVLFVGITPACGQAGKVGKELAEQAIEQLFKGASREVGEELVKLGGRSVATEILERAALEGGEPLIRKVVAYSSEHGVDVLRSVKSSPKKVIQAIDEVAPESRGAAFHAIAREPEVLVPLVEKYGVAAVEAAVRHPGVGAKLAQTLGKEGLDATKHLTKEDAITIARHADQIAALPPAERSALYERLRKSPSQIIGFLEKHPRTVLTAAAVAVILGAKDELLSGPSGPGSGEEGVKRGLVYNIWRDTLGVLSLPLQIGAVLVILLVCLWIAIHIWGKWRSTSLKQRLIENKLRKTAEL